MGSYVDQSLTRNESVISRAQTSWIPTIIPVIIGILLLPFYGLGLLICGKCKQACTADKAHQQRGRFQFAKGEKQQQ